MIAYHRAFNTAHPITGENVTMTSADQVCIRFSLKLLQIRFSMIANYIIICFDLSVSSELPVMLAIKRFNHDIVVMIIIIANILL